MGAVVEKSTLLSHPVPSQAAKPPRPIPVGFRPLVGIKIMNTIITMHSQIQPQLKSIAFFQHFFRVVGIAGKPQSPPTVGGWPKP